MLHRVIFQKLARQLFNILAPLAQRRHTQLHDIQTIKEVFTKCAPLNRVVQINIRQRHEARINFDRPSSAEPLKFALFDDAQKFRLSINRKMRDFV